VDPFFVLTVSAGIISVSLPAAFYAGIRVGTSHAEADQVWFRSELRQANDRLFAVSREPGAVIPPRIEEPRPPIELSDKLEAICLGLGIGRRAGSAAPPVLRDA